jgi:hypothetical protein
MGAADDDGRSLQGLTDFQHEKLHALARGIAFARNLFLGRHQGLGVAEGNDHVAALITQHAARDEVAFFFLELVVDALAFGVLDALDDDLLGGLRRDAAELFRGDAHLDNTAYFGVLIQLAGLREDQLGIGVRDLVHHFFQVVSAELVVDVVEFHIHFLGGAVHFFSGRRQGGLDGLDQFFLVNTLGVFQLAHHQG